MPRTVIVYDHGFKNFEHKLNLNRWLIDQGFLSPKFPTSEGDLKGVDWSRSQAYAIDLNCLFLNLAGREGQGCVSPE